jgi:Putative 2OG-Fe(II) oxygenase
MISSMFHIPIYQINCVNWALKKPKLLELCRNLSTSYCVSTDYFTNKSSYDKEIEIIFADEIYSFTNQLQLKTARVQRAWFEMTEQHGYHGPHRHGQLGYSAVCYIDFDKNVHTATKFIAPFTNWLTGTDLVYSPDVVEGTIVFFPSAILHYTEANHSQQTRRIVSFNLDCRAL